MEGGIARGYKAPSPPITFPPTFHRPSPLPIKTNFPLLLPFPLFPVFLPPPPRITAEFQPLWRAWKREKEKEEREKERERERERDNKLTLKMKF